MLISRKVEDHREKLVHKSLRLGRTEAEIEGELLEMFHEAVGFNDENAMRQVKDKASGRTDFLLLPDRSTRIVVEVKRPAKFKWDAPIKEVQPTEKAILQAARYLVFAKPRQEFGIATDGVNWIFFQVSPTKPKAKIYKIHPLLQMNIAENPELARFVFNRLKKSTIKKFFQMLTVMHFDASEQEFYKTMDLSLEARADGCAVQAQGKVAFADDDRRILRAFYESSRNSRPWLALLNSKNLVYELPKSRLKTHE